MVNYQHFCTSWLSAGWNIVYLWCWHKLCVRVHTHIKHIAPAHKQARNRKKGAPMWPQDRPFPPNTHVYILFYRNRSVVRARLCKETREYFIEDTGAQLQRHTDTSESPAQDKHAHKTKELSCTCPHKHTHSLDNTCHKNPVEPITAPRAWKIRPGF